MASIVFFRAVNVGGHQKFHPGVLAKKLTPFDVVNVGAAGTFIVRKTVTQAALRAAILRQLPFKPELMICPAREILALAQSRLFQDAPAEKDVGRFVSMMTKRPQTLPYLPFDQPAGGNWEVRIIGISDRFALSVRRKLGRVTVYPNAVVEKLLGLPATTRNWNTISTVCSKLNGQISL